MGHQPMTRRAFLRFVAGTAAMASLAACQPKIVKETAVVEKPVEKIVKETVVVEKAVPAKGRVMLRFLNKWGSGIRRTLIDGFLDEWAEKHPEIGIVFEPVADFDRRLPVLMAAGETADVMLFFQIQMSMFHHLTMDLTPFFENDPEVDFPGEGDLMKVPEDVGWIEGKVKAIPFQFNMIASGINIDLFEKVGVPMPWEHDHDGDKWWNWDDYLEAAIAINELGDDIWGCTYSLSHEQGLYNWTYSNGGKFMDLDKMVGTWNTPEVIEAQKFAVDMRCKYGCMMNPDEHSAMAASLGIDPFFAGKVGITDRCDLAPLRESGLNGCQVAWCRSPRTKKAAGVISCHFHVMSKDTPYPDEAWEFMKFLSSFESQKKIAMSGTCEPVRVSVWEDQEYQEGWPGNPVTAEARTDNLKNYGFTPNPRGYQEWKDEMNVLWGEVLRCEKTVEEQVVAVDKMTTELLRAHAEQ